VLAALGVITFVRFLRMTVRWDGKGGGRVQARQKRLIGYWNHPVIPFVAWLIRYANR
jgi:hypothetical protein